MRDGTGHAGGDHGRGTNAAARRGILVRDGIALERAGKITAIVFDKTGTLTEGKPVVAAQEILLTPIKARVR